MFTRTTLRLPCRPCNCVLSCPRFRSWYGMNILHPLNTSTAVSKVSKKHDPGISFQHDPRRVSLSYPEGCFDLGSGENTSSIFKLRSKRCFKVHFIFSWWIGPSSTGTRSPPRSGLVTGILFLVLLNISRVGFCLESTACSGLTLLRLEDGGRRGKTPEKKPNVWSELSCLFQHPAHVLSSSLRVSQASRMMQGP